MPDSDQSDATPTLADRRHGWYAIKTWRYLRMAMIVVVLGLAVAVLTELLKAKPECFQTSISAYYFTPVRGYFVCATFALGLCLICLRGTTETEDVLLNLAGVLAPVVALVPTEYSAHAPHCTSVPTVFDNTAANVANNVLALLVVGAIALLIVASMIRRKGATLPTLVSSIVAGLLWLVAAGVFLLARGLFVESAHFAAAVPMFLCIAGAAVVNAFDVGDPVKRRRYATIAALMVIVPSAAGAVGLLTSWTYTLIVVETLVLLLFCVFWAVQTLDLWDTGLRPESDARRPRTYEKVIQGRISAGSGRPRQP